MTDPSRCNYCLIPGLDLRAQGSPAGAKTAASTGPTSSLAAVARWSIVAATCLSVTASLLRLPAEAQTAPAGKQVGTVKAVSPNKLTIQTDAGQSFAVTVVDDAKVLQLTPGSTDLKTATTIALRDIETGDRILVTGHQDAADAFTASRVILMKSSDIAQKHEAEQEDWQKRGAGGLVSAVDTANGTITISARSKKIAVQTSSTTVFRRYAGDSVKYQDAVAGTLSQIQSGDQLRVRGAKSEDGMSIQAEEIVSGAFRNLAGTIASIDVASDTLTIKDLATKKTYSVKVTANSNIHALPPEAAARFAARAKGTQLDAAQGAQRPAQPAGAPSGSPGRPPDGAGERHGAGPGQATAGGDLSQLIARLPQGSLADLHVGEAVMLVASQAQAGSISLTAITLLSGVEPIIEATPSGTPSMTLSPWNFGGGDAGGA